MPMSPNPSAARKVGILLLVALAVGMAAIFLVGDRRNLFSRKNDYYIRLDSVSGLQPGSNVQLDGVGVGSIAAIDLSEDVQQNQIGIRVRIEARFAARIREDSMARIRTLGLLGDKYIEISSGSPKFPEVQEGGDIATAPTTDVDRLRASGEDLVNNVTRITEQLTTILGRMERGEGILGELTRDVEPNRKVTTEFIATLDSIRGMFDDFREGDGPLPRLLNDRTLGDKLEGTVTRLDSLLARTESGEGALSMLLTDSEQRQRLERSLASIERTTANLESVTNSLQEERALLPKLLGDEAYGEKLTSELQSLVENLNRVAEKLDHGTGSAAQMLNDPALYLAMKDIVSGIDESAILRRLIRNRQKKGVEVRLDKQLDTPPPAPPSKEP
jgi:phospholipid/cholesterol/gamma-HCH transport system substrate-binding protein